MFDFYTINVITKYLIIMEDLFLYYLVILLRPHRNHCYKQLSLIIKAISLRQRLLYNHGFIKSSSLFKTLDCKVVQFFNRLRFTPNFQTQDIKCAFYTIFNKILYIFFHIFWLTLSILISVFKNQLTFLW